MPPSPKTAVITGAARGLGLALALELAGRGFDLALINRDESGLKKVQELFDDEKQKVSIHGADISNEAEVQTVRDEILAEHGRVDWLINNAGVSISQPFEMIQQGDFEWLFNTNFWGTIYCCRHFLPALQKSDEARIVNVSSIFAFIGLPWKSAYAASKAALMGFSRSLKSELKGSRVIVSVVIPPPLNTNIVESGLHVNPDLQNAESAFLRKHGASIEATAKQIVDQILKGSSEITPGLRMWLALQISRLSPSAMQWLVKRMR